MLDLKAKLAAAGLVSAEDVARAEARARPKTGQKAGRGRGRGGAKKRGGGSHERGPTLDVAALQSLDRGRQYEAIRRFVDAVRLDPLGRTPSEHARNFHFPTEAGGIGRIVIEPHLSHALGNGEAAVVAFMSNHGLAHAVVPADAARAIATLQPTWLRSLADPAAAPPAPDAPPCAPDPGSSSRSSSRSSSTSS